MKTLIFTASGDYARFRCPYSTTSALTFTVMHPIAVKGLVGAVMGVDYKNLYEYTNNMKIAVQVLKPVRKDIQSFNYIPQVKNNGAPSFQTRIEFLRDVSYRIFISDDDEKLNKIKDILIKKEFVFTPYLGASEHIAKINYQDIVELEDLKESEGISADTVIPKEFVSIENRSSLYLDRIPVKNDDTREYTEYEKVAFACNERIKADCSQLKKAGEYNVYFF